MTPEVRAYNQATISEFRHKIQAGVMAAITIAEVGIVPIFPPVVLGMLVTGAVTIQQAILAGRAEKQADILYKRAKATLGK